MTARSAPDMTTGGQVAYPRFLYHCKCGCNDSIFRCLTAATISCELCLFIPLPSFMRNPPCKTSYLDSHTSAGTIFGEHVSKASGGCAGRAYVKNQEEAGGDIAPPLRKKKQMQRAREAAPVRLAGRMPALPKKQTIPQRRPSPLKGEGGIPHCGAFRADAWSTLHGCIELIRTAGQNAVLAR